VEVPHHGTTPPRSRGATPLKSHGVVLSRSRARAVEELRPHREGRREEQSHTSMDGRERVVADALNLGEMEIYERE
jgi:hypothetical protein